MNPVVGFMRCAPAWAALHVSQPKEAGRASKPGDGFARRRPVQKSRICKMQGLEKLILQDLTG